MRFAQLALLVALAQAPLLVVAEENYPLWTYSGNEALRTMQLAAGDMVFAGFGGIGVRALNASDGRLVWSRGGFGSPFYLAVGDGILIVAAGKDVYALNQSTGEVAWEANVDPTSSCVAVSDGRVYLGSDDSMVVALSAETGGHIWTYVAGGPVISIAAGNGTVYVRSAREGLLDALDGASGTWLWTFEAAGTLDRVPVPADGMVLVASGHNVFALEAATGIPVWIYESDRWVSSPPALANDSVLVGLEGRVDVLDKASGELKWSLDLGQQSFGRYPAAPHETHPAAAEGKMFLLSTFGLTPGEQGYLYEAWMAAFDLSTHEEIWSYPITRSSDPDDRMRCLTPVVLDGKVLIGISYGRQQTDTPFKVFAFEMEPGHGVRPVCLGASLGQVSVEPGEFIIDLKEVDEEQNLTVSVHSDGFEGDLSFRMYVDWSAYEKVSMNYAAPGEMTYMDQYDWGPLGYLEPAGTLEATIGFKLGLAQGVSIDEPLSARCWVVILPAGCFSGYFDWDLYWELRSKEERSVDFVVTMLPEGHGDVFGGCTGVGLGPIALTPENLTVRVGEEAELRLSASSGGLGNLRYEGNISLDWDSLIPVKIQTQDTWAARVEGLDLEYYFDRAPTDPWDYLGFLEAGGVLMKTIRLKILASQDGFSVPTEPIKAWARVAVVPSHCDDWEAREQARRYSNWIMLTILPPSPAPAVAELVWERAHEGVSVGVIGLAQSQDGGFVVAGSQRRLGSGVDEGARPLLLKVDEDGRKVWERLYGAAGTEDRIQCVVGTQDGGIAVTGARTDTETWTRLGYVMKTDQDGRKEWEVTCGFGEVTCIVQCEDQGYLVAGGRDDGRDYVLRLNENGSKVWETSYQGEEPPRCVVECADGGFVLGGRSSLVKLDDGGSKVWVRNYPEDGEAFGIVETEDGFILAGGTGHRGGIRWHRSFVLKVGPDGTMLWHRAFDGRLDGASRVEGGYAFLTVDEVFMVNDEGDLVWEKELPPGLSAGGVVGDAHGGLALAGVVQADVCVAKVDGEGNVVWVAVHGDADWFGQVVGDGGGGYVAVGWTQSSNTLSRDPYLLQVGGQGEDVWEKTYGGEEWEAARCIVWTGDGFVVAGSTNSPLGNHDTYVFKVDSDGDQLWEEAYGVEGLDDWAECLVGTSDGGFVVAGGISSEDGRDIRVLKANPAGGLVWERTYSCCDWDSVRAMVVSGDGGFVLVGETWEEGGNSDALVFKIDGGGNLLWERCFGGDWSDGANCVLGDGRGGYVVGGYTSSFRSGNQDPYLFGVDGDGSLAWQKNYWGRGRSLVGIAGCSDGGYMAVGDGMYLLRVDEKGDPFWEDALEGYPTSMVGTQEEIYVVSGYTDGPRAHLVGFREVVPETLLGSSLLLMAMSLSLIAAPRRIRGGSRGPGIWARRRMRI